ncbi:MAG: site-specific integrase [Oscillibacter sp.]|nr:site-specific integrase [Oscillibacter sp.]
MPRKASKPKASRRGKNEGSIYKRNDGKWVGQITVGYHPDTGKPIRKYFYANTREEAARKVAMTLATEMNKDSAAVREDLILKDFLHKWLTTFKVHEVCSRTMELYYSAERLHIVPALGGLPINQVTPVKIQGLLYQLQAEKGLSQRTISLVRGVLIQMYDYAMEMRLAEFNPARNTKLPRQPRKPDDEKKVIPIAQREALLKAAENDEIMCPILTMLMLTGMRIGELLALQWKHIDFVAKTISIQQSLTREIVFDENGRTQQSLDALGATKTRTSRRVIQVPDLVLERLRRWMKHVAGLKGGLKVLIPDGFVFVSTRTMEMRTYSGFRATYRHFLDRNGFGDKGLNLHRFRHTYASMLLEQGINPKIVQKLLGHRDVSTTLGVYTHVVPEVFAGVTGAVNAAAAQLLDGTYAPKLNEDTVRKQMQALDPLLSDDAEITPRYR